MSEENNTDHNSHCESLINTADKYKNDSLIIYGNELRFFPKKILKIKTIEYLNLAKNYIRTIPAEIKNLKKLRSICLRGNKLKKIPVEICSLKNLEILDLRSNELTELPEEIGKLKKLKKLLLNDNQLKTIPKEIVELQKLQSLSIENNPLISPPIEIVKQGFNSVIFYFKSLNKEEIVKLYEAKLLIVGQGNVGKTYLLNKLIGRHQETDTTEGVDIHSWHVETRQTNDFKINFWDFGGQEIYHATHQFFLTKRSLYLFVWEARTDSDLLSFDYWLNTIKVLSDNSPVIVIQNKIDERKKTINQRGWQNRFPNIEGFFDVSALKGMGIDSLKETIIEKIQKLPHIGDLLPESWEKIRKKLTNLNQNYISYQLYLEICEEFDLDDDQAKRLSEYYHDLGVFLHFQNNLILKHTIFLNPEWATNAVYKVTDNQEVIDSFGKFTYSDLANIWTNAEGYPEEKHLELIELMKNFEICFELPLKQNYILPELLPANQPIIDWDNKDNMRYKYVYDFMPAGVVSRFIVKTHELIKENYYWKDGVLLSWQSTEALIVKTNPRVIDIYLRGKDNEKALAIIQREMKNINSSFSNLLVDELVQCFCGECLEDNEPYFFEYKKLQKAKEKGKSSIECQKSFLQVSIDGMVDVMENIAKRSFTKIKNIYIDASSKRTDMGDTIHGNQNIGGDRIGKINTQNYSSITKVENHNQNVSEILELLKDISNESESDDSISKSEYKNILENIESIRLQIQSPDCDIEKIEKKLNFLGNFSSLVSLVDRILPFLPSFPGLNV